MKEKNMNININSLNQLKEDYKVTQEINHKYLEPDLKEIIKKISDILEYLLEHHIIDLEISKWFKNGQEDNKTIKKEFKILKDKLVKLYYYDIRNPDGNIEKKVIKKRKDGLEAIKGLLKDFTKKLEELKASENVLIQAKEILESIRAEYNPIFEALEIIPKEENRESLNDQIHIIRKHMHPLLSKICNLLNLISYLDSVTKQLNLENYTIEEHIIEEFKVRLWIQQSIEKGQNIFGDGSIKIKFEKCSNNEDSFDETCTQQKEDKENKFNSRYNTIKELYKGIVKREIENSDKLFPKLPKELKLRKNSSSINIEKTFELLFFNKKNYIIKKIENGREEIISNPRDFNHLTIQFLIHIYSQSDNFHRIKHSIIEPSFITPTEMIEFTNFKTGRETSKRILNDLLEKQYQQNEINQFSKNQIWIFMTHGFSELEKAQDAIEKEIKGKKIHFHSNLIKKPFIIHQLMLDILRIAIISEARAIENKNRELVYIGRDSGYFGGNTVAFHGYNNHLKYKLMLELISKKFDEALYKTIFDSVEHFKSWIFMALHDVATYDRPNSISFGDAIKFGNDNKKAHKLIGSYILKENKSLKKLFGENIDELSPQKRKEDNLNFMSKIVAKHDYDKVHFDLKHMKDLPPNIIKELISLSISGIADNSAGIGVMYNGSVPVDPWIEKGSNVFLIEEKAPGNKSNPEIMFEILKAEYEYTKKKGQSLNKHKDARIRALDKVKNALGDKIYKDFLNKNIEDFKNTNLENFFREELENNYDSYYKTTEGKEKLKNLEKDIENNINTISDESLRNRFLGKLKKEFSPFSAIVCAGVINSGYMEFDSFDGTTLKITIKMDKEINRKLTYILGEKNVFKRIYNFINEYNESLKSKKITKTMYIINKIKFSISNYGISKENTKKLETIGLEVNIITENGIIEKCLSELSKKIISSIPTNKINQERYKKISQSCRRCYTEEITKIKK